MEQQTETIEAPIEDTIQPNPLETLNAQIEALNQKIDALQSAAPRVATDSSASGETKSLEEKIKGMNMNQLVALQRSGKW